MNRQQKAPLFLVFALGAALCLGLSRPGLAAQPAGDAAPRLSAEIDRLIEQRWRQEGVQPAPLADDAEFHRRVWLDLAGQIPPVVEVRGFLADKTPDKRAALIVRLLDRPSYVNHFTHVWRNVYLPETEANLQLRYMAPTFDAWLRKQLMENIGYDKLAREMLSTPMDARSQGIVIGGQPVDKPTPGAFYQAKEMKAENLGAATARLFLGLRVECAQCHDHPFSHWKRQDFWSHAAFFDGANSDSQEGFFGALAAIFPSGHELKIPDTGEVVTARFIDGSQPAWKYRKPARETLADWVTSSENPYFSKALVNRVWAWFFGVGLVDPVDDLDSGNLPSHPELLDLLAREFAAHDFDLKYLMRAVLGSRTYQLSSRQTHASQSDPRLFARASLRGLSAEQLFDSVSQATGYREKVNPQQAFVINSTSPRGDFLEKFSTGNQDLTERQTSIVQALTLMNGRLLSNATNLQDSKTLAAVADCPLFDTAGKIETLFLATLTRKPRPEELKRLVKYVESGGPEKQPKAALADVFWALLNSSEFSLNH